MTDSQSPDNTTIEIEIIPIQSPIIDNTINSSTLNTPKPDTPPITPPIRDTPPTPSISDRIKSIERKSSIEALPPTPDNASVAFRRGSGILVEGEGGEVYVQEDEEDEEEEEDNK